MHLDNNLYERMQIYLNRCEQRELNTCKRAQVYELSYGYIYIYILYDSECIQMYVYIIKVHQGIIKYSCIVSIHTLFDDSQLGA